MNGDWENKSEGGGIRERVPSGYKLECKIEKSPESYGFDGAVMFELHKDGRAHGLVAFGWDLRPLAAFIGTKIVDTQLDKEHFFDVIVHAGSYGKKLGEDPNLRTHQHGHLKLKSSIQHHQDWDDDLDASRERTLTLRVQDI